MGELKKTDKLESNKTIKNLNVNYDKISELSKYNMKIAINAIENGIIVLGVANVSISFLSPLLLIPGGLIVYKTVKTAIEKHKELVHEKSKIKK